jgi:hypothetical protein
MSVTLAQLGIDHVVIDPKPAVTHPPVLPRRAATQGASQ